MSHGEFGHLGNLCDGNQLISLNGSNSAGDEILGYNV